MRITCFVWRMGVIEMERMKSSHNVVFGESIVSIFWVNKPQTPGRVEFIKGFIKGVRTYPGGNMTLDDCYDMAVRNGYKKGVITVCCESPLHGEIYKYGNHGSFWEKVGETDGYA